MKRPKGRFITLEGGEGAGKTTGLAYIRQKLESAGVDLICTREPGGTGPGEKIRDLLLDPGQTGISSSTELLLMFASRAQHLDQLIMPALEKGTWVLCDRFTDATFAYQGGGRGIAAHRIEQLESWVQQGFQPDITILFDLPVETGMQRASKRGSLDRFEQEQQVFFESVRQSYLQRAHTFPGRFRVIDSSCDIQGVQAQLDKVIDEIPGYYHA